MDRLDCIDIEHYELLKDKQVNRQRWWRLVFALAVNSENQEYYGLINTFVINISC